MPGNAGDNEASARHREGVRPGVTAAGGWIVGYPMPEVMSSSLEFALWANYPCRWRDGYHGRVLTLGE